MEAATVGAPAAGVAPAPDASKKVTTAKKAAPTARKRANSGKPKAAPKKATTTSRECASPRKGSKAAMVVALLQRRNGATLGGSHGKDRVVAAHRPRLRGRRGEEGQIYKGERTYRIKE